MSHILTSYTNVKNAVGVINGTSEDEVVIVGNHRDAWIVGGAADPNSGSAVLIELAKAFGALTETGWKPKRTIVLCSWDAEEYGLVGR
jgi:N-acetylated-alpha-linked acidic dipeptidase